MCGSTALAEVWPGNRWSGVLLYRYSFKVQLWVYARLWWPSYLLEAQSIPPFFFYFDSNWVCFLTRAYFRKLFHIPYPAFLNDLMPFYISTSIYIIKLYISKLTLYENLMRAETLISLHGSCGAMSWMLKGSGRLTSCMTAGGCGSWTVQHLWGHMPHFPAQCCCLEKKNTSSTRKHSYCLCCVLLTLKLSNIKMKIFEKKYFQRFHMCCCKFETYVYECLEFDLHLINIKVRHC